MIEFAHNGQRWVYEFTELTIEQVRLAEAVFEYKADSLQRQQRSLREYFASELWDVVTLAVSYLLRQRSADGGLQPYPGGVSGNEAALQFLRSLPAGEVEKIEKVALDFFDKRGRLPLYLIVQSRHDLQFAAEWGALIQQPSSESSEEEKG